MLPVETEVTAALRASPLPLEGKACMAAISDAEGAIGSFRTEVGSTLDSPKLWQGSLDSFPVWYGWPQPNPTSHAVGAWQDEPATWGRIVEANPGLKFDRSGQVIGNWWLAQQDFRSHTGSDLVAALAAGDTKTVRDGLKATWPSVARADVDFPALYTEYLAFFSGGTIKPLASVDLVTGDHCHVLVLDAAGVALPPALIFWSVAAGLPDAVLTIVADATGFLFTGISPGAGQVVASHRDGATWPPLPVTVRALVVAGSYATDG